MNVYALAPSLLIGAAVVLLIIGFKYLGHRDIQVSKFKPFYDHKEEEKYKEYEKILSKSKVPFKTAIILIIIGGIGIGVITYVVVGVWWIALLSFAGGFFIPKWWYEWHLESNKRAMQKQMEQACEIMATVLKTGSGLTEALEKAAVKTGEPLKTELIKTATQIRIGVPMSSAFMEFTQTVNLPEMTVLSISIELKEKGMGIDLANLFLQLQNDIRNKMQTQKEITSKTNALKFSGYLVATMPFLTVAIMRLFSPEFIDPMFTNPIGIIIFIICCGIIILGTRWMLNLASLKDV
ncbi:type II secretion system F family protein [Wukongibacter baidiensis]